MRPNPCRIDQTNRHAVDGEALLDRVARRSWKLGDDRSIFAEERVEQRRFAGVRRPDDRDGKPFAHQAPDFAVAPQPLQRAEYRVEPPSKRRAVGLGDLVGEVDCGREFLEHLGQRAAQLLEPRSARAPPRFASAARAAARVSASMTSATAAAACRSIFPLRKARRVNSPGVRESRSAGQQRAHDFARDDRRAVNVKLEHIFAGIAVRRRKEDREPFVERIAALRRGSSRGWRPAARSGALLSSSRSGELRSARAADADDRDRALSRRRRNRGNGFDCFTGFPPCVGSTGKYDDSAFGLFAFGFRAHQLGSREREMDDLSLRGKHRFELLRLSLAHAAFERRERKILELIGAMGAISLGVDRVVVAVRSHAGIERVVEEQVERFERIAVAPDQARPNVRPVHFEILAFRPADVANLYRPDAHAAAEFPAVGRARASALSGTSPPSRTPERPRRGSRRRCVPPRPPPDLPPGGCPADRSIANVGGLFFKLEIVFVEHRRNLYLI